jgi:hypothetical protein
MIFRALAPVATICCIAMYVDAIGAPTGNQRYREFKCPDSIRTREDLIGSSPGWRAISVDSVHYAENIQISKGPFASGSLVVPAQDGRDAVAFDLDASELEDEQDYWMVCYYGSTGKVLTQALPRDLTECRVEYMPNRSCATAYNKLSCH